MQKYSARAEVDPTGTADMPATSFTKHPEDERLHQMRLAARLGTGAARAAPQDEETEEKEEGEAQWPTSGSAGSWWSGGESWSYWQYNWPSNWGSGSASGKSWTASHLQRQSPERQWAARGGQVFHCLLFRLAT